MTSEEMAETVARALRLVPTAISADVLDTEKDVVGVEMDGGELFFLKVIEA